MTESKKIHAALLAARVKMEAPKKVATNPHFGSKYAPLDELVRVSFAPLAEQGLMLTQHTEVAGDRMALVTRILSGFTDEPALDCGTYDLGPLTSPQAMGSSISYARRYVMAAVLGLAAEEDDDGNSAEHAQPVAKPAAAKRPVTGDRAALESNLLIAWKASRTPAQKADPEDWKNRGAAIKKLLSAPRFVKPADMTDEQLQTCIEAWGGVPDAAVESTGQTRLASRTELVALVTAEAQKRGLNFAGLVKAMRSMGVYVQDKENVLMADLDYNSLAEVMMKWTGVGFTANANVPTDDDPLPF